MKPKTTVLAAMLALTSGAALAQYDPGASRAENQVNSINRSMMQQQQIRGIEQQQRFETNSLRNELSKPAPPPIAPNLGGLRGDRLIDAIPGRDAEPGSSSDYKEIGP